MIREEQIYSTFAETFKFNSTATDNSRIVVAVSTATTTKALSFTETVISLF